MAHALHYVVTGASRGLGLEFARILLEAGHTVTALARSPNSSKGLGDLLETFPDRLKVYTVDVSQDSQVEAFVRNGGDHAVDVLINNAGIYGEHADFTTLTFSKALETFDTNALGPMRITRALLPRLKKSASPKVANITSLMGSIGDNSGGGGYAYRMSKVALNMFHKSFAIDFPHIVSLVFHPGWVATDMGGEQAPTSPRESASGILKIVDGANAAQSGKFYSFDGGELPW